MWLSIFKGIQKYLLAPVEQNKLQEYGRYVYPDFLSVNFYDKKFSESTSLYRPFDFHYEVLLYNASCNDCELQHKSCGAT